MSERKKFNFYKSYYDVFSALENDNDKLAFIKAILDKQFIGKEPNEITGMAKFAYMSQRHSIDAQVKGYEDKTGIILQCGTQGGTQGGTQAPYVQPIISKKKEEIYKIKDHLSITWDEFNKLVDEFGNERAEQRVNDVLNYRKNTNYKSLYLTALKWLKKDESEKEEKQKPRKPIMPL